MAQFEKQELPDSGGTGYYITDDSGHTAQLSAEQAYDLLHWLNKQFIHLSSQQEQPGLAYRGFDSEDVAAREHEDRSNGES